MTPHFISISEETYLLPITIVLKACDRETEDLEMVHDCPSYFSDVKSTGYSLEDLQGDPKMTILSYMCFYILNLKILNFWFFNSILLRVFFLDWMIGILQMLKGILCMYWFNFHRNWHTNTHTNTQRCVPYSAECIIIIR